MGTRYILDTNVVLDFMGKNFPEDTQNTIAEIIDEEINISLITKIELLGFSNVKQNLVDFVSCANVLALTDEVVSKTIELRRKYKRKLPDIIIAATAIVHNLTIATRNVADFQNIDNLSVWNPWDF
ncbi:MAG: type II toxin-antitoxin system VapC family toxin [Fibromonadaceae bacterium]|nr:type II toxin-antitoxin system VapC family toxin [Fibromonadaceae bacterium]